MTDLRNVTLCYLVRDNNILLGLKKRGFGQGRWNGYGGKVEPGESIERAAVREIQEEMDVSVLESALDKVAVIDFYFTNAPKGKDWNQRVHVFVSTAWQGEPKETEEMRPQWFPYSDVPINEMWADDPYWLPKVLKGKKIRATFTFGQDNASVHDMKVSEVDDVSHIEK